MRNHPLSLEKQLQRLARLVRWPLRHDSSTKEIHTKLGEAEEDLVEMVHQDQVQDLVQDLVQIDLDPDRTAHKDQVRTTSRDLMDFQIDLPRVVVHIHRVEILQEVGQIVGHITTDDRGEKTQVEL